MSPARAVVLALSLLVPVVATGTTASATTTTTTAPKSTPRATTTTTTSPNARSTTTTVPAKPKTRTITYSVASKGKVSVNLDEFARQVAETLADQRGWSRAGLVFTRVASGGQFTVWLSVSARVPSFGKPCDAVYSCRAGRNVVINEDRWKGATASWTKVGGSLREYRNLVVNHEVGHWLGHGHASCRKGGAKAAVMQQQSKSLGGCVANAWPLDREIASVRVPK